MDPMASADASWQYKDGANGRWTGPQANSGKLETERTGSLDFHNGRYSVGVASASAAISPGTNSVIVSRLDHAEAARKMARDSGSSQNVDCHSQSRDEASERATGAGGDVTSTAVPNEVEWSSRLPSQQQSALAGSQSIIQEMESPIHDDDNSSVAGLTELSALVVSDLAEGDKDIFPVLDMSVARSCGETEWFAAKLDIGCDYSAMSASAASLIIDLDRLKPEPRFRFAGLGGKPVPVLGSKRLRVRVTGQPRSLETRFYIIDDKYVQKRFEVLFCNKVVCRMFPQWKISESLSKNGTKRKC